MVVWFEPPLALGCLSSVARRVDRWVGGWLATKGRVSLGLAPDDSVIAKSVKLVHKDEGRVQETSAVSHLL